MNKKKKKVRQILNYVDLVLRNLRIDSEPLLYVEEHSWIEYVQDYIRELEHVAESPKERELPQHILDYWISKADDIEYLKSAKAELRRDIAEGILSVERNVAELELLNGLIERGAS